MEEPMEVDGEATQNLTQSPWQGADHWPGGAAGGCALGMEGLSWCVLVPLVPSVPGLTPRRSSGGTEPCIPSLMYLVPYPGQCHGYHS